MADQRTEAGVITAPLPRSGPWVVTAPHEVPRGIAPDRQPWGMSHVREDRGRMTACGLPTVGWRTFWNREFLPHGNESCPACASAFVCGAV